MQPGKLVIPECLYRGSITADSESGFPIRIASGLTVPERRERQVNACQRAGCLRAVERAF
jgi:hypothetical protein